MTSGKKKSSRKSRKTPVPGAPASTTPDPDESSPVEKLDESSPSAKVSIDDSTPSAKVSSVDDSAPSSKVDVDSTSFAKADPADLATSSSEAKPKVDSDLATSASEAKLKVDSDIATSSSEAKPKVDSDNRSSASEAKPKVDSDLATSSSEAKPKVDSDIATSASDGKPKVDSDIATSASDGKPKVDSDLATSSSEAKPKVDSDNRSSASEAKLKVDSDNRSSASEAKPKVDSDLATLSSEAKPKADSDLATLSSEAKPKADSDNRSSASEAKPKVDSDLFMPLVPKSDESVPIPKTEITDDNLTTKASPPPAPEHIEPPAVVDTRPPDRPSAQNLRAASDGPADRPSSQRLPRATSDGPTDRPSSQRLPRAASVKPSDDNAYMPSPEWMLGEPEKAAEAPPPSVSQQIPVHSSAMPDPKAAALEAARIVGEIVGDVESAGGAAIVAAAAAGAAIEAARARAQAQAEGRDVPPVIEPSISAEGSTSSDPVVTVRMQRDRILRALAEDVAAQAEAQQQSKDQKDQGTPSDRAPSAPGPRAPSTGRAGSQAKPEAPAENQAPAEQGDDEELDAVQIAAAAIQRLRKRAQTDLAELKTQYHRHDILVLLLAFVIIIVAGRVHRGMVTAPTTKFSERGLTFEHSTTWLSPEPIPSPAPRIAYGLTPQSPVAPPSLYHVLLTSSLDPDAKLEVLIDKKPAWSNIVTGLELDRRTRWGELYTLDDSSVRSIAGHDWLRTAYRFAHVADKGDVPRVGRAIEFATIDREQIYVVTFFGGEAELARIESVVAPSLRVPTQTGLPLVPQTRMLSQRTYPNAVARAFDSTVMVVVADLVDGRLRPRGGGSGVVVGSDGSILTNYHVIHDKDGRLHDVFVIGRFSQPDHAPQLWCAGRPSRSKLQKDLDLALVKCDLDLDGRAWVPAAASVWPTLPEARTADIKMGQRLWVLGYPDVGGGGLTLSEGSVEGWTGENGTAGKDFIKTDASITHGNSGGPVVDDHGRLVGVAAAFRTRTNASGGMLETAQVGLVRPLSTASDLLAIAQTGWTPREGHTDVDLQPSAVEAPGEGGVRISTRVLDAANEQPVRDALVMILRPGVNAKKVDVNRLDDQVLSWGRSNTQGEVQLKQPVPAPGTYSVMIVARGYEPLVGEGELHLDAKTPAYFDPWGKIWLRSR
jgi:S1-C subfamily serine protease